MTFRRRTIAVAIAAALLVASPAAAATSSFLVIPGQLLQLAHDALLQLSGWVTGGVGLQAKATSTASEDDGADGLEGVTWDPDGVNNRCR